jgi:hypothetical protein
VISPNVWIYHKNEGSDTSEETKILEKRPNKRNTDTNLNLDSHFVDSKRPRPTIGSSDDTLLVGPSTKI